MNYFDSDAAGFRRSGRKRSKPKRLSFMSRHLLGTFTTLAMVVASRVERVHSYSLFKHENRGSIPSIHAQTQAKEYHYQQTVSLNCDGTFNGVNIFNAKADNETYMFHEILKMPDKADFVKAMVKELEDHEKRGHWIMMERKKISNAKVIKTVWSFKRKRRADGTILKHKARLCAHGGMQVHGDTYWDTYAPVVNWMNVRLMLIFSEIHSLHTRSIDFTLAFP